MLFKLFQVYFTYIHAQISQKNICKVRKIFLGWKAASFHDFYKISNVTQRDFSCSTLKADLR